MKRFYEEIWKRLNQILDTGLPPITFGNKNKWSGVVEMPPPGELILPETKFQVQFFSDASYDEALTLESVRFLPFDGVDMLNLRTEFSVTDLFYTKKEDFLDFCFKRLGDSLDTLIWYKYKSLLSTSTKQEYLGEDAEVKYRLLDIKLGFPLSDSYTLKKLSEHRFDIEQKARVNSSNILSISLTPPLVGWHKKT